MLRNPAYMGRACFGKTQLAPRQCTNNRSLHQRGGPPPRTSARHERPRDQWIAIPVPALISEDTLALAQERLVANNKYAALAEAQELGLVQASRQPPGPVQRIVGLPEADPYSAQQIFQRPREQGFTDGATIVKDYVRKARPPRGEAFLKLSFEPGECAQIDWDENGTIAVANTPGAGYPSSPWCCATAA